MKKRLIAVVMIGLLILGLSACSNPKRDAEPTDVLEDMYNGEI